MASSATCLASLSSSATLCASEAPQRRLQLRPQSRKGARIPRKNDDAVGIEARASAAISTSKTSEKDNGEHAVLFFAYGALMDQNVMLSRLQGKARLPLPSSRAALAVAFARGEGKRGRGRANPASSSPSSHLAVAFVHRGGWATLVDLQKARAFSESFLWELVPGSRKEEEQGGAGAGAGGAGAGGGGGWTEREKEKNDDDFFTSGSCFSSPAHGVLYSLSSESDLEPLAEKEGGYSLRKVEVRVGEAGEALDAFAFVSSPGLSLRYPLPPRERYLEKMRAAAKDAKLDERYRAWLERVPSTKALDGRYQATPAGSAAAAVGVAVFAVVVTLLV